MVWEHNVTVILMATHLIEGDVVRHISYNVSVACVMLESFVLQVRCFQYWPDKDSATLQCDNLEVELLSQEMTDFSTVSTFHLKQNVRVSSHILNLHIVTEHLLSMSIILLGGYSS